MQIRFTDKNKASTFKELPCGEVFKILSGAEDSETIYMKVSSFEKETEVRAINLSSGVFFRVPPDAKIKLIKGFFVVEEE